MNGEPLIGPNIIKARRAKGWTQKRLADETKISPASLSSYEHNHQMPSLITLAKIAKALNVTIDCLYYGPMCESMVTEASSQGEAIVNCLSYLWNHNIIATPDKETRQELHVIPGWMMSSFNRLLNTLDDYAKNKETFSDPKAFVRQLQESVARELDKGQETRKNYSVIHDGDALN